MAWREVSQTDLDMANHRLYGPSSPAVGVDVMRLQDVAVGAGYLKSSALNGTITAVNPIPATDISGLFYQTVRNAGTGLTQRASWNASTGLTAVDNGGSLRTDVTANLSTGVSGGQSAIGGTAASETLTLSSTTAGTKGKILFGTSTYDEANDRLGIGTASPIYRVEITSALVGVATLRLDNTAGGGFLYISKGATGIGGIGASGTWLGTAATDVAFGSYTGKKIQFFVNNSGTESMSIQTDGTLNLTSLTVGGIVKAAAATGKLAIASAADVAAAITWPAAPRVLISSGTSTAPVGDAKFTYDTTNKRLIVAADITGDPAIEITTGTIQFDELSGGYLRVDGTGLVVVGVGTIYYQTVWNSTTPLSSRPVLNFSTGLTAVDNSAGAGRTDVTANLSTGVSGGQSAIGGTATGNALTLRSNTSNDGKLFLGNNATNWFNEGPAANAPVLSIGDTSGTLSTAIAQFTRSTNTGAYVVASNTNAGTAAIGGFVANQSASSFTNYLSALIASSAFTTVGPIVANSALLESVNSTSSIMVISNYSGGGIGFYTTTNRTERLKIANVGSVAVNGAAPASNDAFVVAHTSNSDLDHLRLFLGGGTIQDANDNTFLDVNIAGTTIPAGRTTGIWSTARIRSYTLTGASSPTITEATALYIDGAPTISGATGSKYAVHVASGETLLSGKLTVVSAAAGYNLGSTSSSLITETGGTGHDIIWLGNAGDSKFTINDVDVLSLLNRHNQNIILDVAQTFIQGSPTVVSATSLVVDAIKLNTGITFTGTTAITTATGVNAVAIPAPTYVGPGGGPAITNSASVYIGGAPNPTSGVTMTNRYALWIDSGVARFDGGTSNSITGVFELPADATGNTTNATGRIPIIVGAALKYLRYFDS